METTGINKKNDKIIEIAFKILKVDKSTGTLLSVESEFMSFQDPDEHIDEKIQIIHTHLFHAMVVASLVKIICPKIKIIWTSHSINIGSSIREIISFFFRPFRLCDILLFDGMKQYYHINNQSPPDSYKY